jgi:D-xylose 1-dehydrogenase (NADP+, D-xylono-1,5-lactone-forming)
MTDQKLRWGVLSTARIGINAVIPAIQQSSNGVVAAIASRDATRAQEVAKALNIPRAFGSYDALLESSDIDAVYIPLPNHMHHEWTIRAAERGKHILCEKPFALNAAQVDEMIAAAKQHHVLLMEAFMYRFHPQFAKLKALIAEGAIGKVQTIRSAFGFFLDRPNDIRIRKETGGGALMDVGCYCVNMARLVTDAEPLHAQAEVVLRESSGVDDSLAAIMRFPGDVIALFDCSFRTDYREWLQVQGTKGRLDVPRPVKPMSNPAEIILSRGEKTDAMFESISYTVPAANHYRLMVEHFADAVLNGAPLRYPPELDRGNMRVIDALYESARTGHAVQL